MAGCALCGCTGITSRVALLAFCRKVRPGKRKIRRIVVKSHVCIAGLVTGVTGRIFINIAIYAAVTIVGYRIDMAIGAGKFCVIGRILVAIRAF